MTTLHYTPNENDIGVRIHGINLARPMSALTTLEIRRLLHQYKLVIFEQQGLEDGQLCAFAHRFGPPFVSTKGNPVLGGEEHLPNVIIVGNRASDYGQAYLGYQLPFEQIQRLRPLTCALPPLVSQHPNDRSGRPRVTPLQSLNGSFLFSEVPDEFCLSSGGNGHSRDTH